MEKLSTLGRRSQIKLRSVKSNQIAPEARARAASSGVRGDMVRVGRAARRGREVGHIRMLSRAAARRDPGTGQRAGWRGASGYMSGALGLLSHWFDSGDVRCARAAARARATRF